MSRNASIQLDQHQLDAFQNMKDEEIGDTHTERHKMVLDRGFRELGYIDGSYPDTVLRSAFRRLADSFAIVGLMMVGLTLFMPLEVRALALGPFIASIACYTIDRVLKRVEPSVSNRLMFWRGESA